jgi:hypothetical protein
MALPPRRRQKLGKELMTRTFQSALPVWEATITGGLSDTTLEFQSTLPVWEATAKEAEFARENAFFLYKTFKQCFFSYILS